MSFSSSGIISEFGSKQQICGVISPQQACAVAATRKLKLMRRRRRFSIAAEFLISDYVRFGRLHAV